MNFSEYKKINLPDEPGVYLFKKNKIILYIGKATLLKDRVKSYFTNDLIAARGPLIVDMVFQTDNIDFIKTGSVLEALILESNKLLDNHLFTSDNFKSLGNNIGIENIQSRLADP